MVLGALEKMDRFLSLDTAWKSRYQDESDIDELLVPESAELFVTLLLTMTGKFLPISMFVLSHNLGQIVITDCVKTMIPLLYYYINFVPKVNSHLKIILKITSFRIEVQFAP